MPKATVETGSTELEILVDLGEAESFMSFDQANRTFNLTGEIGED